MSDARARTVDRSLGFLLVPTAAYVASSMLGARNAMAPRLGMPDPETVRLRKQTAYLLGATAVGALIVSRVGARGSMTSRVAEGGAVGSAIAAVVAYLHAIRTPPVPIPAALRASIGNLVVVPLARVPELAAYLERGPNAVVLLRVRSVTPIAITGPIERYRDPVLGEGPFQLTDKDFTVSPADVTAIESAPPPTTGLLPAFRSFDPAAFRSGNISRGSW